MGGEAASLKLDMAPASLEARPSFSPLELNPASHSCIQVSKHLVTKNSLLAEEFPGSNQRERGQAEPQGVAMNLDTDTHMLRAQPLLQPTQWSQHTQPPMLCR